MTASVSRPRVGPAHDEPVVSIRTVTPEMATTWLSVNSHNRPLRPMHVDAFARVMAQGGWHLNGETIKLSKTGVLLDGQHRLAAVVAHGVPQQFVVVTNLPDDVQNTIDTGARRSAGDALALAGIGNGNTVAAVAKMSVEVEAAAAGTRVPKLANSEILAVVEADPLIVWVVSNVVHSLPWRMTTKTVMAYAYLRLHKVDPDACATFFHALAEPYSEGPNSPIAALHRRFTSGTRMTATMKDRLKCVAMIFGAWNAWRGGEDRKLAKLRPRDDGTFAIPTPV